MYKTILFEWDGCIADTLDIWLKNYREFLKPHGFAPSDREIVHDFFGTGDAGPNKYGFDGKKFYKKLIPIVEAQMKDVKLNIPKSVLSGLLENERQLGLVSTSNRSTIMPAFEFHNLQNLFEVVIAGNEVSKFKPDPEQINKAMEILKAEQSSTIIIGDTDKDILAGKNAGIKTCLFFPEVNQRFHDEQEL